MPTIEDNYYVFHKVYDWARAGDEWSDAWGSTERAWRVTVEPRIGRFLDCGTILEIAPGFGRWTQFLVGRCESLVGVDLSPRCIEACRSRFAEAKHARFQVNDGTSLDGVEDASVDFAFSFDSLVHADPPVLRAYLGELARVLKPGAHAFLHHSNLGEYQETLPKEIEPAEHWRSRTMTAEMFRAFCREARLDCLEQELVNWGGTARLPDCFSTVATRDGGAAAECRVRVHARFMEDEVRGPAED